MEYSIRPEEHELREVRRTVQAALEMCKEVLPKEEDVRVSLGWTEDGFVKQEMDGAAGEAASAQKLKIHFHTGVSGWEKAVEATVSHEYAHTWFHEQRDTSWGDISFNWEQILMDAHAQHFTEKNVSDHDIPIKDAVSEEEIKKKWEKIREILSMEIDEGRNLFYGGGDFKNWTGYTVAYLIGQKLLEKHDLEEFPGLKRSDVIEAGNQLFR